MATLLSALSWRKSILRFMATGAFLVLLALLVGDGWLSYRHAVEGLNQQRDRALVRANAAYARAMAERGDALDGLPMRELQEATGLGQPPHLRFRVGDQAGGLLFGEPDLAPFRDALRDGEPLCGRLQGEKNAVLYGARQEEVQSSALLALSGVGLVAVGSHDPNRFYPGMGTLFLRMMGEALVVALERFGD